MNRIKIEHTDAPELGFDVEIKSGGRAYDAGVPARPTANLSPARAAAKSRSRRRVVTLAVLFVAAMLAAGAWAWFSNPDNFVPSDALARVNGEYIYEHDVTRELNLTRVSDAIAKKQDPLPSAPSVLEDLINRKLQVEDARKAGVTITPQEVDNALDQVLQKTGLTKDNLSVTLAKYDLTIDDMRAVASDTYLINKYKAENLLAGASSDTDRQNRLNDWQTRLAQNSKVDRLKAAGSGPEPTVGKEAPDFTLKSLDGKDVKLSSLRGKAVMINFWATWCPPCRSEIPTIAQMYKDTHSASASYEILGVATQSDDPTIRAFTQEFNMNFVVLPDAESRITSLYHVLPIPTTFFIDKEGIVRYTQVGPVDRPLMEKWLLGR